MPIIFCEEETLNRCKRCGKTGEDQQLIGEILRIYKGELLCSECINDLKEMEKEG